MRSTRHPRPALRGHRCHLGGRDRTRIGYDNTGTDAGEAIEIAAPAGTDLSAWTLLLYNGSDRLPYDTDPLAGVVPGASETSGPCHSVIRPTASRTAHRMASLWLGRMGWSSS